METRKWTGQDGVEKYTTEIVLKAFNGALALLDRASGVPAASDESDYGTARQSAAPAQQGAVGLDDEIPF